jgi:hypothetical protein
VGLLAQTGTTLWLSADDPDEGVQRIVHYHAVFWTPVAVLSLVAGTLLARPMRGLLRRVPPP